MKTNITKVKSTKGRAILTIVAIATLLMSTMNFNINSMNVNAFDLGLISKDTNVGSIDTDNLFNCFGAAITCDNDNTVNNNVNSNNGSNPPPGGPGTLEVTKLVTCFSEAGQSVCTDLEGLGLIPSSSDYPITVTGNNPNPSNFPGSNTGTEVALGAGDYTITETLADTSAIQAELGAGFAVSTVTDAQGDCTANFEGNVFVDASGTMTSGGNQECIITNEITLEEAN